LRERDHYTPQKCLYTLSIINQQAGTAAGLITLYDDQELLLLLWYGGGGLQDFQQQLPFTP
jgi:hypothetical protein